MFTPELIAGLFILIIGAGIYLFKEREKCDHEWESVIKEDSRGRIMHVRVIYRCKKCGEINFINPEK